MPSASFGWLTPFPHQWRKNVNAAHLSVRGVPINETGSSYG